MKDRLITFEEKLSQSPAEAILVTGQKNVYYLTGFWEQQEQFLSVKIAVFS